MGLVRMGPPEELVVALQRALALGSFVETGTYLGHTAAWAARHFAEVVTIEADPTLHRQAVERHRATPGIRFVLGDSRAELERLVPELPGPSLFWLDAHWSGGATAGVGDQCPLLAEIAAVDRAAADHVILVDDARLFLSPPPPPNRREQWPSLSALVDALAHGRHHRFLVVSEDVLVAVPPAAEALVAEHCQRVNARAWAEHGRRTAAPLARLRRLAARWLRGPR